MPVVAGHRERPQSPRLHQRGYGGDMREEHRHLAGQHILHCSGSSGVWHMDQADPRALEQQYGGHVRVEPVLPLA